MNQLVGDAEGYGYGSGSLKDHIGYASILTHGYGFGYGYGKYFGNPYGSGWGQRARDFDSCGYGSGELCGKYGSGSGSGYETPSIVGQDCESD